MTVIVVLTIVGIVAILLELLLLGVVLGVLGVVALIVASIQVFNDYGATPGLLFTFSAFAVTLVAFLLWMKYFDKLPFGKSFILHEAVGGEDGSGDKSVGTDPAIVGKRGITVTDLQPSGRARIDGERHDVVAESGAIDKDTEIEVIAINPIPVVRAV